MAVLITGTNTPSDHTWIFGCHEYSSTSLSVGFMGYGARNSYSEYGSNSRYRNNRYHDINRFPTARPAPSKPCSSTTFCSKRS
jgi:hypothetical protein